MTQYQSFPDAAGASSTLEKLKALCLPEMAGKSFLDVGCNEGFFCGFARYQGAARVVGIDHSQVFIDRARKRFPDCDFMRSTWDELPEGTFDVILLASALHYAEDQPALIKSLVDRLADDGILVLEIGIYSSSKAVWKKVKRSIDERLFPSMPMLGRVLAPYAWKWMGPSVNQSGDPLSRHVVHVSKRRPVAYLLMQPPGYGKTSIASSLFPKADIPVVSGDRTLSLIASGEITASEALRELVEVEYSPYRIDHVVQRAFEEGHGNELARLWLDGIDVGDVALDAYVPEDKQEAVQAAFTAMGYMPVQLGWQRAGPAPLPQSITAMRGEAFYLSLMGSSDASSVRNPEPYRGLRTGHVDEVQVDKGRISILGWAIDERGQLPVWFQVRFNGRTFEVREFERQLRPDVQQHLGLSHALVGYRLLVDAVGVHSVSDLGRKFRVEAEGRGALAMSGSLQQIFRNGSA